MNRHYDIGFILNPETTDDNLQKVNDSIVKIVKDFNGTVKIDNRGRKALAYPIKKHKDGIYVFMDVEVEGAAIAKIERRLKLSESVLRYVAVRLDERLKKSNKLVKKWTRIDKLNKRNQAAAEEAQERRQAEEKKREVENAES